ncbi:MAG: ribonuclease E/G [Robiginitomaculum sp.]|nr:MAG: ribonuclease E/G [Robiginitomaculum sp.]
MTRRMLIDAAHPEQTRVAIVDGNRVEEFDFESQNKKQLRGNIYLAKVTRVEPSLQAAFVDYGGNRHGFLAFNEIHPDYYQIPVEDRIKLIEAEAAEAESEEVDEDEANDEAEEKSEGDENVAQDASAAEEAEIAQEAVKRREKRRRNNYRRYKIQEVIKHGQIMLIQVVKEERGTKGAALTTYMSLAGRYCVLMPNTAKGGGISRKITNAADRKRLKKITSELDIAKGMGMIIRTAGAKRNKTEIKRDYDYLSRLWGTIRETTLKSSAPSLVHEEGGLVRRAVRDLYDKDIESIIVEGDNAFEDAKEFMKMLMPSHEERVIHYQEKYPIFLRYQVEDQLETIHSPEVQLKSGGYLVIHQTEALVAIDVNSGRATRERNIEATAVKTNLEAAEESCRQMRLRDLAGLIVIDFIDMEENKNNRAVEKRMKDSLKRDRARVQAGRISMFGLFEMSRQRRRASVIEGTTQTCPTCNGLGVVRSTESSALQALQGLESEGMRKRAKLVKLTAPSSVALYILNEKRSQLAEIEINSHMRVIVETDTSMHPPMHEIEVLEQQTSDGKSKDTKSLEGSAKEGSGRKRRRNRKPRSEAPKNEATESSANENTAVKTTETTEEEASAKNEDTPKRRRRGRRGGRSRNKPDAAAQTETETVEVADQTVAAQTEPAKDQPDEDNKQSPKRRVRRSRKSAAKADAPATSETTAEAAPAPQKAEEEQTDNTSRPKRVRRSRRSKPQSVESKTDAAEAQQKPEAAVAETKTKAAASEQDKPKRRVRKRPGTKTEAKAADKATKPARAPRKTPEPKPDTETQQETVAAPKKTKRSVRKRPSVASKTSAEPAAKAAVKAKATAETKEAKAPAAKPAAKRTTRPRKKPSAAAKTTATKPAAKRASTQKTKPEAKSEPEQEKPTTKKGKRSWRSRIFGDGDSE